MKPLPTSLVLENEFALLEPMNLAHKSGLAAAAADGALWNIRLTSVPVPEEEKQYIESALKKMADGSSLPFTVFNKEGGKCVGTSRFYNYEPENAHILIGHTWFSKSAQGSKINPSCKLLMLQYAFEELACGAVEFHVDELNAHSLAAVKKLGAKQDGVLRNHKKRRDGSFRNTVSFSITCSEWPKIKRSLLMRIEA